MDSNLHTMMLQNVPSIELNRRLLQNEINSRRVAQILVEASQPDLDLMPARNHSRNASYYEDLDQYNATVSADEYSYIVTTAHYGARADAARLPAGENANDGVNLNLARKRPRTPLSATNKSITKDDFAALNRISSASRRALAVTVSWNSSSSTVIRTGVEQEWNISNTTLAITNGSVAESIYCPAIPPGLRELSIC